MSALICIAGTGHLLVKPSQDVSMGMRWSLQTPSCLRKPRALSPCLPYPHEDSLMSGLVRRPTVDWLGRHVFRELSEDNTNVIAAHVCGNAPCSSLTTVDRVEAAIAKPFHVYIFAGQTVPCFFPRFSACRLATGRSLATQSGSVSSSACRSLRHSRLEQ